MKFKRSTLVSPPFVVDQLNFGAVVLDVGACSKSFGEERVGRRIAVSRDSKIAGPLRRRTSSRPVLAVLHAVFEKIGRHPSLFTKHAHATRYRACRLRKSRKHSKAPGSELEVVTRANQLKLARMSPFPQ